MTSSTSGADLARLALAQAKAAARHRGETTVRTKPKPVTVKRGNGRDPVTLGGAVKQLAASRGWDPGTAGGTLLDTWPAIAPELAPYVTAVHYDPARARLDLLPVSPAYATGLRLMQTQLVQRINTRLGRPAVRDLRILSPRPTATTAPASAQETPSAPEPLRSAAPPPPEIRAWRQQHAAQRADRDTTPRRPAPAPLLREPEAYFHAAQWAADDEADRRARATDSHRRALHAARTRTRPTDPKPLINQGAA
jgi:predicted nucleic acid-binding Zn ribbon protein